jgi:hypothetical protein
MGNPTRAQCLTTLVVVQVLPSGDVNVPVTATPASWTVADVFLPGDGVYKFSISIVDNPGVPFEEATYKVTYNGALPLNVDNWQTNAGPVDYYDLPVDMDDIGDGTFQASLIRAAIGENGIATTTVRSHNPGVDIDFDFQVADTTVVFTTLDVSTPASIAFVKSDATTQTFTYTSETHYLQVDELPIKINTALADLVRSDCDCEDILCGKLMELTLIETVVNELDVVDDATEIAQMLDLAEILNNEPCGC